MAGADKAEAVARAVAGDPAIPGGRTRGARATRFFVDAAAAGMLDTYECGF